MTGSLTFSTTRRPKRRWGRGVVVVLVLVVVAALVVAAVAGGLWTYAWARLGGDDLPALTELEEVLGPDGATSPADTTTLLVTVTEDRDPTIPGEAPLLGPVALVQVGGARGEDGVVLVLPAELRVAVDGRAPAPLAEVHETGGPDLLVRVVMDYTGIAVDHVVSARRSLLDELVTLLDPVEVCDPRCLPAATGEADRRVGAWVAAEGDTLGTAVDGLVGLLRGLGARLDPATALRSPFMTRRVIDAVADLVVTDVDLRGARLLDLAPLLAGAGNLTIVTLPGVVNPTTGALLVLPEQAELRFAMLREGGVAVAIPEDDETVVLAEATVVVQNGTGTDGFAARLETRLVMAGIRVVGTENASNFDHAETVVLHAPDDPVAEAAAILVARELGGVELRPADRVPTYGGNPVSVQVIAGADLDTSAPATGDDTSTGQE